MLEAQARAVGHLLALAERYRDAALALVSHQDIIKAVLAYLLGLSLDALHRFEIGPASVSTVVVDNWGARVMSTNQPATA